MADKREISRRELVRYAAIFTGTVVAEMTPLKPISRLADMLKGSAAEAADLIRISSPEEAARTYGADNYSRNPANWEINEFGGGHLKPDSNGDVHRINVGNAALEAYNEGKNPDPMGSGGVGVRAQTMVVAGWNIPGDQKNMDIRGGTFWKFTQETREEGVQTLWGQVTAKERVEQPGIAVLPVGFVPGTPSCPQIDP